MVPWVFTFIWIKAEGVHKIIWLLLSFFYIVDLQEEFGRLFFCSDKPASAFL